MPDMTSYDPGTFSWIDLATTDREGAKAFYGQLLGWVGQDDAAGPGIYTMFQLDGAAVAAAYEMSPDQAQGITHGAVVTHERRQRLALRFPHQAADPVRRQARDPLRPAPPAPAARPAPARSG